MSRTVKLQRLGVLLSYERAKKRERVLWRFALACSALLTIGALAALAVVLSL